MNFKEIIEIFMNDTKKQKEFFGQKLTFMMSPFELVSILKDNINDYNLIDVRLYDEYIDGHIPFAIHIPIDNFEEHLNMLEKDRINIIYCQSDYCIKATKAALIASCNGFRVKTLIGGYYGWKKQKFDTVKNSD